MHQSNTKRALIPSTCINALVKVTVCSVVAMIIAIFDFSVNFAFCIFLHFNPIVFVSTNKYYYVIQAAVQ